MELKGRKILYAGCSRGVGFGVVQALVKAGANVVGFSRNMSEEKIQQVKDAGEGTFTFMSCDVTNEDMVFERVDEAAKLLGGIDVLVCCIMQYVTWSCEEIATENFEFGLRVNFLGPVWLNQAALPYLKESQGSIINFGSGGGVTTKTVATSPPMYSCAKAALHIWTKDIAKEWGKAYNISANVICPMIFTEAHQDNSLASTPQMLEYFESCKNNMWLTTEEGKPYGPEAIAPLMVFMCSPGAKYITGQLINCDGGMVESR